MSSTICYPDSTDWACADQEWLAELDPDVKVRAEMLAWSTLVSLSGYQFSICPITVRPCSAGCAPQGTYLASPVGMAGSYAGLTRPSRSGFQPHVAANGQWVNSCGCARRDDCSCTALSEVILPGPVGAVTEVLLDGAVLDPSAYRVDNGNRLVRLDGGVWPACQDMAASDGVGTFFVTYYLGIAPNALLDYAAGVLAQEYALACLGSECRLPSNVTAITRQGVSYQMNADPFGSGFTGIEEVDAVVRIYNPNGLKSGPVITSPDARSRARVTTWRA